MERSSADGRGVGETRRVDAPAADSGSPVASSVSSEIPFSPRASDARRAEAVSAFGDFRLRRPMMALMALAVAASVALAAGYQLSDVSHLVDDVNVGAPWARFSFGGGDSQDHEAPELASQELGTASSVGEDIISLPTAEPKRVESSLGGSSENDWDTLLDDLSEITTTTALTVTKAESATTDPISTTVGPATTNRAATTTLRPPTSASSGPTTLSTATSTTTPTTTTSTVRTTTTARSTTTTTTPTTTVPANILLGGGGCAIEGTSKSLHSLTSSFLRIVNLRDDRIAIYWLDYEGERRRYAVLGPDEIFEINSYLTHPWVVVGESGSCIGAFVVDETVEDFAVR